jgi:hypothetical protein
VKPPKPTKPAKVVKPVKPVRPAKVVKPTKPTKVTKVVKPSKPAKPLSPWKEFLREASARYGRKAFEVIAKVFREAQPVEPSRPKREEPSKPKSAKPASPKQLVQRERFKRIAEERRRKVTLEREAILLATRLHPQKPVHDMTVEERMMIALRAIGYGTGADDPTVFAYRDGTVSGEVRIPFHKGITPEEYFIRGSENLGGANVLDMTLPDIWCSVGAKYHLDPSRADQAKYRNAHGFSLLLMGPWFRSWKSVIVGSNIYMNMQGEQYDHVLDTESSVIVRLFHDSSNPDRRPDRQ